LADCFTKRGGLSKQGLEEFGDFPTVGRIKTIGALLRGFINEFK